MEGQSYGHEMVKAAEIEAIKNRELFELSPNEIVDRLKFMSSEEREKYLDKAFDDPRNIAMVSYYEKWLHKKTQQEVDEIAAKKIEEKYGDSDLPLGLEARLSPQDLKILIHGLFFIQPTFGCSKACPFCAFDAPGGVRSAIAPKKLENLFKLLPKQKKDSPEQQHISLHYASEPSDYEVFDETTGKTYTYKDIFAMAYRQDEGVSFLTRGDDNDWLDFVKQSNMRRSLDNATAGRLERQEKKRGYAEVKIHDAGGKERIHLPGIGLSTKKTRERIGKKGIYGRKPGVVLTPRGVYNMFPGEIQPDAPIGAPQGVLAVPLGELRQGEKVYDTIVPGAHLRDVMGEFLIQKMFDTDLLTKPGDNLTEPKTNVCLVFTRQPNNEGRLITYDEKTYRIKTVQVTNIPPEEYIEKYSSLKKAAQGLLFKPDHTIDRDEIMADLLKIFPAQEKQIGNLMALSEILESEEGRTFLTILYKRYFEMDSLGFKWQLLTDSYFITLCFKEYIDKNSESGLFKKTWGERKQMLKELFVGFIDSPFLEKINKEKKFNYRSLRSQIKDIEKI